MIDEHRYEVLARWRGNRGNGTSHYREYGRDVDLEVAGKPLLLGSADVPFHGDGSRWNPEDMLLAALAECHLLSYLFVATTQKVVVTDYSDRATGLMRTTNDGGGAFEIVTLHPVVTVADDSMVEAALAAHHRAHELCYIARSVNFPVVNEPTILVAGADTDETAAH